jgi:hypothetical protein
VTVFRCRLCGQYFIPGEKHSCASARPQEPIVLPEGVTTLDCLVARYGESERPFLSALKLDALEAPAPRPRPTLAELEAILSDPRPHRVVIVPNGEVRAVVDSPARCDGCAAAGTAGCPQCMGVVL